MYRFTFTVPSRQFYGTCILTPSHNKNLTLGLHHFPYVSGVFILPVRVLIWGPDQGFPLFACASQASFQRFPRLFFRLRLLRSWGWFLLCDGAGFDVGERRSGCCSVAHEDGWRQCQLFPHVHTRCSACGRHRDRLCRRGGTWHDLGRLGRAKGGTPLRTSGGCQPGGH